MTARFTRQSPRLKVLQTTGDTRAMEDVANGTVQLASMTSTVLDGTMFSLGRHFVRMEHDSYGVRIAAQDDSSIIKYSTPSTGTPVPNRTIADKRARYWSSGTNVISWEVGPDQRVVYIDGKRLDLTPYIGTGFTIRAACIISNTKILILVRNDEGKFFVKRISYVYVSWSEDISDPIAFDTTPNTGEDTDVKQLYSAFLNPYSIVSVETRHNETRVYQVGYSDLFKYWQSPVLIDTIPGIAVTASLDYERLAKIDRPLAEAGGGSSTTVEYNHVYSSPKLVATDQVDMTGQRVVACNSNNTQLALLIQNTTTSCEQTINAPRYSRAESYYIVSRVLMHPSGIFMGMEYDYGVNLSGFDSGKLQEQWDRSSTNSYSRTLYTFSPDKVEREVTPAFDGGSFTATSLIYERYAVLKFVSNGYGVPLPPPPEMLIALNRDTAYSEKKDSYRRTWDNAVKLYCADPLNEVYVYETQSGSAALDSLVYESRHYAHPAEEDLAVSNSFTGINRFVLQVKDTLYEIAARPIEDEPEYPMAYRYMLHFEPTMPYYTQNQPKRTGNVAFTGGESKTINKSIDLGFMGRYLAQDNEKVGVTFNLDPTFDKPSNNFPAFIDQRYWFFSDYSPFPIASETTDYHRFFEGFRTEVSAPAHPDTTLWLDFRLFEDKNRILWNATTESNAVQLPADRIPVEWAEIRGWQDFLMRGRFGPWAEAKGMRMITKLFITPSPQSDAPLSVTVK